jgi:nicotinamidase-related amidase
MTSFLPPPSERPSLPKQSPPAQSAHAPLTAAAISTVHTRSAHITPAGTHPSPFALPSLAKGWLRSVKSHPFLDHCQRNTS